MSTIAGRQRAASYRKWTSICGNCKHEKREQDPRNGRTSRVCNLHGWYVLMSATCADHEVRPQGESNAPATR